MVLGILSNVCPKTTKMVGNIHNAFSTKSTLKFPFIQVKKSLENLAKKNIFTQEIGPLDSEDRKMQEMKVI